MTRIPGWEGSIGPFPAQYGQPHVYARDIHSGAGNCVCGRALGDSRHVQAAPGVPVPDRMRPASMPLADRPGQGWCEVHQVHHMAPGHGDPEPDVG